MTRPGSLVRDPAAEQRLLGVTELTLLARRHLACVDLLDQQALVGLAGHDRRPAVAPLQDRGRVAEIEAPLELPAAVALHAAFHGE